MSKTKKAFYNIISQTIYELVVTICSLILPRLIILKYGSGYNGLMSSITQFLEYISVLTLGISGTTRVALYKTIAKDDVYATSAVLKANKNYMRKVGYAFIVYTCILVVVFPIMQRADFSWFDVASLVLIISLYTLSEYFFGITSKTFLMASQSQYVYTAISILTKTISTALCVIVIINNGSVQLMKLIGSIVIAVGPIIMNYYVHRKYGIIDNVEPDDSALKQRKDVAASSIANTVHSYVDIFLLTLFTNTKIVSVYTIYTLVSSSLRKIQVIFTTGLEGAFGDLWARGQKKQFAERLEIYEYLMFSFVSVVFTCASVLILPFVSLYTKGVTDINYILPSFAILSVLATAFFSLRTPYLTAVQAAGKYKETKNGAILEAFLNFSISIVGVFTLGLVGVTIGTLVANVFRTVQYSLFVSHQLINRPFRKVLLRFGWLCLNVIAVIGLKSVFPVPIYLSSWTEWIVYAIKWFGISFGVTLFTSFIFYKYDLSIALSFARKMIKKR